MKRFLSVLMGLLVTLFVFGKAESALVAYWPMDEGTGIVVEDVAGNYDGVIVAGLPTTPARPVVWTGGLPGMGSALMFNGSGANGDFVDLTSDITLTSNFTISVWVNTTRASGWNPVFSVYNPPTTFVLSTNTGVTYLDGSNYDLWRYTGVNSNEWTHVAVTAPSGGPGKIYIDGEEIVDTDLPWESWERSIITGGGPPLTSIGGDVDGFGIFNGSMDELKIYDSALTADEVKDEYDSVLVSVANYYLGVCCDTSLDELQNALDACLGGEVNAFYLPPGISRAQEDLSKNKNAVKVLGVIVP